MLPIEIIMIIIERMNIMVVMTNMRKIIITITDIMMRIAINM